MITVEAQNIDGAVNGLLLTLKPLAAGDADPTAGGTIAKWRCGNTTDGTTVPAKYLPGSCRGN